MNSSINRVARQPRKLRGVHQFESGRDLGEVATVVAAFFIGGGGGVV